MYNAHLDSFYGVFNLEKSAFWAKSIDASVVLASSQKHIVDEASSSEVK